MLSRTVIGGESTEQNLETETRTAAANDEVKIYLNAAAGNNTEIVNLTSNASQTNESNSMPKTGSQEKTSALSRSLMKHQLVIPNKRGGATGSSSAENSPQGEGENQALNEQNVTKYKQDTEKGDK